MTITVQPVPAGHPYVERLRPPGISYLDDPLVPGAPTGRWWPPQALRADWIDANAHRFDLLHVHFGTENAPVRELAALLDALNRAERPLVYTVHDIDHPHLAPHGAFEPQLRTLAEGAAAVITLTQGAADELALRYGVRAAVIPHPALAADGWFEAADQQRAAQAGDGLSVGMHLRALRANVRPGPWLAPLVRATAAAGGRFTIFRNDEPLAGDAARTWESVLGSVAGLDGVRIDVRPRPDDDALCRELAALDLAVLPYGHGSHSGWLELCWDLGVPVAVPDIGYLREQHRDPWFMAAAPLETAYVGEILAHAAASRAPAAADRLEARRGGLTAAVSAHAAIYGAVLGLPTATATATSDGTGALSS